MLLLCRFVCISACVLIFLRVEEFDRWMLIRDDSLVGVNNIAIKSIVSVAVSVITYFLVILMLLLTFSPFSRKKSLFSYVVLCFAVIFTWIFSL